MDIFSLLMDENVFPKQFNHREAEPRIYALWEKNDVFSAKVDKNKPAFCVVIPPPNVTGILHMGHVLDNVPQDIMTRWHRMRGFSALWLPGTDHAGIATQSVVVKNLNKEGIKPKTLGREKFIEKVWEWKQKHGSIIIEQLKRLGATCDWTRERFTMDDAYVRSVLTAFMHYYKKGLIYKGKRMINWCSFCETALADDEVEREERKGKIWHFRYPLLDEKDKHTNEFIIVATTRPETMLGDTAVAVHPEDKRYKAFHGRKILLPLKNRIIPLIVDAFVDPTFGSGAVKVTPAHDPNDYNVGLSHKLEIISVMDGQARMNSVAGEAYQGLDRYKAREKIGHDLEAVNLVDKIEEHRIALGVCYRCKNVIEPLVSDQWFVKMRPLAEKAKQAVLDGRIEIVPESEKHDYFHWMDTIQDWCISRQLWWGHRIPVFYCDGCSHTMAALEEPGACEKCGGKKIRQDEDVLDTWFSSQLWPFATLGWPEKTEELKYWFPNTWLMSGRDILFFWDARMIMVALEIMGDVPFKALALHGLVRDEHGRKLSKSLGNSPDPLELFDKQGTDAVRASVTLNYPMGRNDTRLSEQIYQQGQALIIKLWNASRLLFLNLQGEKQKFDSSKLSLKALEDQWIISGLRETVRKHDEYLAKSDFSHALQQVRSFFWNEYCDWYLEIIKPRLKNSGVERTSALDCAFFCHRTLLKLMHLYSPFVTEEIWQIYKTLGVEDSNAKDAGTLAQSPWPELEKLPGFSEADALMQSIISVVRGIRNIRHYLNIPAKLELDCELSLATTDYEKNFKPQEALLKQLGFLHTLTLTKQSATQSGYVPFKFDGGVGYIKIPPDVKVDEAKKRISKKISDLEQGNAGLAKRLSNPDFVSNAPPSLLEETKQQLGENEKALETLRDFLKYL